MAKANDHLTSAESRPRKPDRAIEGERINEHELNELNKRNYEQREMAVND